jgi:DNA-binding CsgD family transcriptional regulator
LLQTSHPIKESALKGSETRQFETCVQNIVNYKSSAYLNIPRDNPYEMVAKRIWDAHKKRGKLICIAKARLEPAAKRFVLLLQSHGLPAAFVGENITENYFLEDGDVLVIFKDSKTGNNFESLVKKLRKLDKALFLIVFANVTSPFFQKNCDHVLCAQTADVLPYEWMYEAELEIFNSLVTITELALKAYIQQENCNQAAPTNGNSPRTPYSAAEPLVRNNFTGREIRILRLFLEGKSRKEIAQSTGLTCSGIDYITRAIGNKLGVRGIRVVLAKAMDLGLVNIPDRT